MRRTILSPTIDVGPSSVIFLAEIRISWSTALRCGRASWMSSLSWILAFTFSIVSDGLTTRRHLGARGADERLLGHATLRLPFALKICMPPRRRNFLRCWCIS